MARPAGGQTAVISNVEVEAEELPSAYGAPPAGQLVPNQSPATRRYGLAQNKSSLGVRFRRDDVDRAGPANTTRYYLCVSFRMRPSAGSIRYAVPPLPATTPRAPLIVATVAFR